MFVARMADLMLVATLLLLRTSGKTARRAARQRARSMLGLPEPVRVHSLDHLVQWVSTATVGLILRLLQANV